MAQGTSGKWPWEIGQRGLKIGMHLTIMGQREQFCCWPCSKGKNGLLGIDGIPQQKARVTRNTCS